MTFIVLTIFSLGRVWLTKAYKTSGSRSPSLTTQATNLG